MLRDPLHINDNDDYSSSEEPTMPKLTIEGMLSQPYSEICAIYTALLKSVFFQIKDVSLI